MKQFEIVRDLEKTPTIIGIRAVYFFILVGSVMFWLLIIIANTQYWLVLFIVALLVELGLYALLYYYTEAFQANKLGDETIANVFSSTP
jgi:apolipoprotein N-acyltransferase